MGEVKHFNGLTPAEAERLACLAEELGEAVQAIGKILRHGYDEWSPFDDTRTTNRQSLERELGDISAVCKLMDEEGDIDPLRIRRAHHAKLVKLPKWTHHQPDSQLKSELSP